MTRVPTFALQQMMLYHTLNTQARSADLSVQLASNKKSQTYSGISQDALRLVSLETRRAEVSQFNKNIGHAEQRLKLMDTTVAAVEDLSLELRDTLDRVLQQPDAVSGNLKQIAVNIRDSIAGLLNTRSADSYLFGGTRGDRQPINFSAAGYKNTSLIESNGTTVDSTFYEGYYTEVLGNTLPFAQGSFYNQIYFDKNGVAPTVPAPADPNNPTLTEFNAQDSGLWQYYVDRLNSTQMLATPKLDHYQGNAQANTVRADAQVDVTYDVRASNKAFQQILSAADAIANLPTGSSTDANERAIITKARDMIKAALETPSGAGYNSITQIRINVTSARQTLKNTLERHESFDAYAEGVIKDIENIDPADVIVRLQSDQQALEASFSVLARLQAFSLLDFI